MKKHINTFHKGMSRDTVPTKFSNDTYYNAEGLRLITNDGLSSFALRNIEGNTSTGVLDAGWTIHGQQAWCVLRDKLIILAIGSTPGTNDRIYSFNLGDNGTLGSMTVLYTGNLEFDVSYPIKKIIPRYESPDIQKIYWTQGNTVIKFCNIVDPNLSSYVSTKFDIIPAFDSTNINIDSLGTGLLKSGVFQYSYQLYNLYGAETFFTTPGNLIPLSNFAQTGSDALFVGSDEGTNSGKSVSLSVTGLDTTFNRIRLVRIEYINILADPTITIIEDTVAIANMTFIDNGTANLGNYTLEEFITLNYNFICQDLETKNNILFAANITENSWDVAYDSRAYRYRSSTYGSTAQIFAEDGVSDPYTFTYSSLSSDGTIIPETHDCFNRYNTSDGSVVTDNNIYQGNGATIGGQGKNVIYSFSTESLGSNSGLGSGNVLNNINFVGATNSLTISERLSHMRDEIYPYAAVLYNGKGQKSYVKWIGDIRFPSTANSTLYNTTGGRSIHNLYIQFTLNNLPNDCVAVQIVRCERTAQDRTIIAQGLLGATRETSTWYTASVAPVSIKEYGLGIQAKGTWTTNLNKTLLEFISPEISFGNNIEYSAGDKLEISSYTGFDNFWSKGQSTTTAFVSSGANVHIYENSEVNITVMTLSGAGQITGTSSIAITDFKIANFSNNPPVGNSDPIVSTMETTVNSLSYENYVRAYGNNSVQGAHGTCGIIAIPSAITTTTTDTLGVRYFIANYKRYIKPYGGASYEARSRRTYLPVGDVSNVTAGSSAVLVTKGDTFISWFEYQRVMVSGLDGQNAKSESMCQVVRFPVESSINTRWQSNKSFTQAYSNESNIPINLNAAIIQENAGAYSKVTSTITANYTQDKDLYSYNSAYSKQNSTVKFYPKQLDALDNVTFDCRVQYSNRKFNNEPTDSWTKFKPLNFKDVDSQYGPINALTNYNSDLIYFQDSGWGILSVEERELLQNANGTQLTTGTGSILSRFDYVSTNGGCAYPNSIYKGRYAMYFYDSMNNSLFGFTKSSGDNNLSKLLGVQSFLNKNVLGNNITDIITGYNPKYNEVLFTFIPTSWSDGEYKTIVFNDLTKQFVRIDKINPSIYINDTDYLYSSVNKNSIWLNNSGNFGQFFGTYYPSKISLVVNPNMQGLNTGFPVNRFDLVQWITDFNNSNHKTFDTIRFSNTYQDSTTLALVADSNLFYVFRTWRFNQLFDSGENRFKDTHMMLELEYTNASNDSLVVRDIITTYSPTAPW